jgi:hypothetical protein
MTHATTNFENYHSRRITSKARVDHDTNPLVRFLFIHVFVNLAVT